MSKIFKYFRANHLSKNNKGCALVGTKTSSDNRKSNNTPTTTSNVCILCLPTTIFVQFCNLVYVILTVGIVQKSCINLDTLYFLSMTSLELPREKLLKTQREMSSIIYDVLAKFGAIRGGNNLLYHTLNSKITKTDYTPNVDLISHAYIVHLA